MDEIAKVFDKIMDEYPVKNFVFAYESDGIVRSCVKGETPETCMNLGLTMILHMVKDLIGEGIDPDVIRSALLQAVDRIMEEAEND